MSEAQWLYAVLTALYGVECVLWVGRNAIVFRALFARRCRLVLPGLYLGNRQGGFVVANPLPPLGQVFVCGPWPLSLTPEAAYAYVSQSLTEGGIPAQSHFFAPLEAATSAEARGGELWVGEARWLKGLVEAQARCLADLMAALAALPAAERPPALDAARRAALDTAAVRARYDDYRQVTAPLRALCTVLLVYLFALTPAAVWWLGFERALWPFLAGLLGTLLLILVVFYRAHKRFYPADRWARWLGVFRMGVYPLAAIRAVDVLARPLLAAYHPLAVAAVLAARKDFETLARQMLLDLHFPRPMDPVHDEAAATERQARLAWAEALKVFLHTQGLNVQAWLTTPPRREEGCRTYCPRCHSQYLHLEGDCPDCGNVPLRSF